MDKQILKSAVRNALGVVVYILVIAWFFNAAPRIFGNQPLGALGFAMMLMLFIISALVTGSLVLWQPAKLLVDGKKKEAGMLLCTTGATLVIALAITTIVLFIVK